MERLPSFRSCFFCGSGNPRGFGIAYSWDPVAGTVVGAVSPGEEVCGYPGILHGGFQSALLDDVIYWAVGHRFSTTSVTLSLTTQFRAPARLGQRFVLRARAEPQPGRKVVGRGGIEAEDGTLVAEAEGLYLLHPREVFLRDMAPHFDFGPCAPSMVRHYLGRDAP